MSTRPTREQYPDFMRHLEAMRAWEQTEEGQSYLAEQKCKEAENAEKHRAWYESVRSGMQLDMAGRLGIPARALCTARGVVEQTSAMEASDGSTDFLVLSGGPGCGKTVAAATWILAFVFDDQLWGKSSEYMGDRPEFRSAWPIWITAAKLARCDRYDEIYMAKILRTPRLVVDDLGGEYLDKGGFYASLLDEIVNERQAESKPTIMTTNLNADAFKERYGERIIDRIREGGRFIGCGDHSLRRKVDAA